MNEPGFVSVDEAKEIANRFINGLFKNIGKEKPRVSIPANPLRDDDIRLLAFIEQTESLRGQAEKMATLLLNYEQWRPNAQSFLNGEV